MLQPHQTFSHEQIPIPLNQAVLTIVLILCVQREVTSALCFPCVRNFLASARPRT